CTWLHCLPPMPRWTASRKVHAYPVPIVTESRTKHTAQTAYVHRENDFAHMFVRRAPAWVGATRSGRRNVQEAGKSKKRPRGPLRREEQRGAKTTSALVTRVLHGRLFDFLHNTAEVVAFRRLKRRVLLERLQVLEPQLLADRQHVPVIEERGHGTPECATNAHRRLLVDTNRLLEWVALDVLHQGEVERNERHNPAGWP